MVLLTANKVQSKTKFNETVPNNKNKTKPKQTQSKSNIKLAYQHVGLMSKSYITSSQYGSFTE